MGKSMKKFLVEERELNILTQKIVWKFIINKKVLCQESGLKIVVGRWGGENGNKWKII